MPAKATSSEQVKNIPLSELHPFKNHPFKIKDDEAMMETADSIRQYGVLVPAIVRPREGGGYEMIAGHRRHHASELAEKDTMPVIVRDLDDDAATIIMVDSNLQREGLLPSERAFAYKMKLDTMKRQAGRPSKENASQVGTQKRSDQIMAEQIGESRSQIQRYIHFAELIPPLLDMTDEKKIALNPAYELSFLTEKEQTILVGAMEREQATPSLSQAQRMKKLNQVGQLTEDTMLATLSDLYDLIDTEYQRIKASGTKKELYTPELLRSALLGLHSICKGADAKFFNGHTNIDASWFVTFGVKDLMESGKTSKTLKNAWGFIASVLLDVTGKHPPKVKLPQMVQNERPFLESEQIRPFINWKL